MLNKYSREQGTGNRGEITSPSGFQDTSCVLTALAVKTQDAVHSQLPLVRNQSELIDDGFDSLTTTNSSQSC
ncbi:hypothetical protein PL10110_920008 [Planktothrix agardhii]|nr:hypothetical protein PL10110_920008 [Planktothrix agardhii]